jgi:hypothetical protein
MAASIYLKTGRVTPGSLGLCQDGYVRLDCKALQEIELIHLVSALDDDPSDILQCGSTTGVISGFTEWISTTRPVLSVGWDWIIGSSNGHAQYMMVGKPRSNIMLVNDQSRDLGIDVTADLLIERLDRLFWQEATSSAITSRYA